MMKGLLYPRLAFTGMVKNRRIYLPYLLTCTAMVMITYIITYLRNISGKMLDGTRSTMMESCLGFGIAVIALFSLIFLFYTGTFVLKRRRTEFGLYNILGMGKGNIARILLWEYGFTALISIVGGLLTGVLFSKLAELFMVRVLGGTGDMSFTVDGNAMLAAIAIFAVIFLLLLVFSLIRIKLQSPLELLRSRSEGERPPKGSIILSLLGALFLAAGYAIALTVRSSADAIVYFFVAVTAVIIGTYLLFISGSVALCRVLQKNKRYYYKAAHFFSTASMRYRMKRNGAGLASICILSTMVLVTVSSTACLYFGISSSIERIPRDMSLTFPYRDSEFSSLVQKAADNHLDGYSPRDRLSYRYLTASALIDDGRLYFEMNDGGNDMSKVWTANFMTVEDYNSVSGENIVLSSDEIMLYAKGKPFGDTAVIDVLGEKRLIYSDKDFDFLENSMSVYPTVCIVLPDMAQLRQLYDSQCNVYDIYASELYEYYGVNVTASGEQQKALSEGMVSVLKDFGGYFIVLSRADWEDSYYSLNGGLFFLGVVLAIVFGFSAVLIMYYKQLTEGYEDSARFDIMRKVGMTAFEIKKSVNSQVLTVFFAPLAMAGLHMLFAYPMIEKSLGLLLNVRDSAPYIVPAVVCFVLYAALYAAVYFITSRAYLKIVSKTDDG